MRDVAAFRAIRDDFPNFDLAAVDAADEVQKFIWQQLTRFDAISVQEGQPLDEYIATRLKAIPTDEAAAAHQWLTNPKAGRFKNPLKVGRDFIADNPPKPSFNWQPRQPLALKLAPVPPLTPAMIPEPLRDWIADSSERIGAPPEFMAVAVTVALASLIGRKIRVRPRAYDDWTATCNLFGASVGRPGAKKSPAMSAGFEPLNKLAAQAMASHEHELTEFEVSRAVDEATAKGAKTRLDQAAKKANSNRDELEQLARQAQAANDTTEPTLRRYVVNDASIESLGEKLRENPNGLPIARDELVGFLKGLERQGHEQDQAFYLEAWNGNGQNFIYDRIGRGTIVIPGPCVSLIGTIQPGPLSRYIRNVSGDDRQRDGFISRFPVARFPRPSAI